MVLTIFCCASISSTISVFEVVYSRSVRLRGQTGLTLGGMESNVFAAIVTEMPECIDRKTLTIMLTNVTRCTWAGGAV